MIGKLKRLVQDVSNSPLRRFRSQDAKRKTRSIVTSIVGLLLVVSALVAVWFSRDDVLIALNAIERPSPILIAAALLLPLLNLLVISWSFCVLYRPTSKIPLSEMLAIIGTAWLLNYLPLRPGMFGRFAYHRKVNGIPLHVSAKVLVQGVAISIACSVWLLAFAVLLAGSSNSLLWLLASMGVPALLIVGSLAMRGKQEQLSVILAAAVARWLDMLIWSARYWVVFRLIGSSIEFPHAILLAAVAQIVLLIPLTGNGLGFREWSIGLVASRFVATAVGIGLVADLVNRVAELIVAIPTGLIAWTILSRKLTLAGAAADAARVARTNEP